MACAFIIYHCSSRELQARAGFDGWVQLLRDEFDTEDQAWPQERLRLAGMAKRKMRRLESGGVELDMLQIVTNTHLLLEPPACDREESGLRSVALLERRARAGATLSTRSAASTCRDAAPRTCTCQE